MCGRYTLSKDKCPFCGGDLVVPHPPRFSPEDKYVMYRLKMKLEKGVINLESKPPYVP
jgi:H/ACA ribonucleoprotein complex subunit 3